MINWKDRHKNAVPVSSKAVTRKFEIKIYRTYGGHRWFMTSLIQRKETKPIMLFYDIPLKSSAMEDAKEEALELAAGRLSTWIGKFKNIISEIAEA